MKVPEIEARKLLDFLSITTIPTPLQTICEYLNIDLVFLPSFTSTDAMYTSGRTGPVIIVNDAKHFNRKRFSLAHEIGHYQLGHGPVSFMSDIKILRNKRQETQANRFAAELLMPTFLLKRYGFLKPEQIADLCHVSLDCARIRAEQLGWIWAEIS